MPKILVIEDDLKIRDNLIDILEQDGFGVTAAENGLVGVQLAQKDLPDLIICDVMMPELDGYQVLEQLRQELPTSTIPFIFLTAKATHTDIRQGMELGADDYLAKPFTIDELRKAVTVRLKKHMTFLQQYRQERDRANQYQRQAQESQTIAETQEDILKKLVVELRNPISNINMAIRMLERASSPEERERYLAVLKEECAREITLLNQMDTLQDLLAPNNIKLLRQFQILK